MKATDRVRVIARPPRDHRVAFLRITCLDTAYLLRERLIRTAEKHNLLHDAALCGLCALGSHGLVKALELAGVLAEFVAGQWVKRGGWGHCWVRVPGVFEILDVTASQFWLWDKHAAWVFARQRLALPYRPAKAGPEALALYEKVSKEQGCIVPTALDQKRWWQ